MLHITSFKYYLPIKGEANGKHTSGTHVTKSAVHVGNSLIAGKILKNQLYIVHDYSKLS